MNPEDKSPTAGSVLRVKSVTLKELSRYAYVTVHIVDDLTGKTGGMCGDCRVWTNPLYTRHDMESCYCRQCFVKRAEAMEGEGHEH